MANLRPEQSEWMTLLGGQFKSAMGRDTNPAIWIAGLIVFALFPRIYGLVSTNVHILAWRPTDLAGIALNFYRNGQDILHPQVLWGGAGPGYVEMEFPLIPFVISYLYRIVGVHDWVALVIPIISGVGVVLVTAGIGRELYDYHVGFVAGIIAAFSPAMVDQTVSLWPDPPMIFSGAVGIYMLLRWARSGRRMDLFLGSLATSLAILLKITALYLGFPILVLCIWRLRNAWWRAPSTWLLAAIVLLPPTLWYWHAHQLYLEYHNTFGILSAGYLKFGTAQILVDPGFYLRVLYRLAMHHLGPLAFLALLSGILSYRRNSMRSVLHVWLAGVGLYLVVSARGVLIGHFQYLLPIVPPAAVLAAAVIVSLLRKASSRIRTENSQQAEYLLVAATCFLLMTTTMVLSIFYPPVSVYFTRFWENDRRTGLAVGHVTQPESLIVVVDNQMDDCLPEKSMTPPNVFYFSDRKGWYRSMSWLNPDLVSDLRREGAAYLVITANSAPTYRDGFPRIRSYLSAHFETLMDNEDGIVYNLATPTEPKLELGLVDALPRIGRNQWSEHARDNHLSPGAEYHAEEL